VVAARAQPLAVLLLRARPELGLVSTQVALAGSGPVQAYWAGWPVLQGQALQM
jgi:hypothetical protein